MAERCAALDCTNLVTPGSLFCSGHKFQGGRGEPPTHYDYLGGEENRRSPVIEEEKEPIECKKCPLCEHLTVIRLCLYHWAGRPVALDEPYRIEPRKHTCDLWVCFYCGLRIHFASGRMDLPDTQDLKLDTYRREDWNA